MANWRAAGWSWARIAAREGCNENTVRQMPRVSPAWWAYYLGQAIDALYADLEYEALHILRGQLRSTDPQVAGAAAGRLLQVVHQAKLRNISAMLASQIGRTSAPVGIDAFFAAAAQVAPTRGPHEGASVEAVRSAVPPSRPARARRPRG